MSKSERLEALKIKIDEVIESPVRRFFTKLLLAMFIAGFKIKRYYQESTGLWKLWYIIIALPLFLYGYVLDVLINATVGKNQFGKFSKFGTLTATLWRVKKAEKLNDIEYYHSEYGVIAIEKYNFAVQVCEVLNDQDEGHC